MPSQSANKREYRIVLGVTGGIAAYKSCELLRLFRKAGWAVRVVMTKQAEQFVGPLTFASLSGNPVLRGLEKMEDYDLSATSHIDLAEWGDLFVVAPATANFLAKFANGICDDALTTEALAFTKPVLVAPAMNTRMWQATVTQENCQRLGARGVRFVGPVSGDLACGEVGLGKMADPEEIFSEAAKILEPARQVESRPLHGLKVLVTSGPTRTYIDPIRFLTNRSSGKMGHALARAAESMGAEVVLVSGPVDAKYAVLGSGRVVRVEKNTEMLEAALSELATSDIVIAAAAVADFEVAEPNKNKIPRQKDLSLSLKPTVDILAQLASKRRPGQVFVGFAAEPGTEAERKKNAVSKLERKGIDILALNDVSRGDIGFDSNENEILVFERDPLGTKTEFLQKASKEEIAKSLLRIAGRYFQKISREANPGAER